MIPSKPGAEDIIAMNNRVKWMEELFQLDGRDQASHPHYACYTGLAAKYANLQSTDGY